MVTNGFFQWVSLKSKQLLDVCFPKAWCLEPLSYRCLPHMRAGTPVCVTKKIVLTPSFWALWSQLSKAGCGSLSLTQGGWRGT